jgi:nucleotide-binding universal stress UspA family protein
MEKLTIILAVIETAAGGRIVFERATELARATRARVHVLLLDPSLAKQFAGLCATELDVDILLRSVDLTEETAHEAILRTVAVLEPDVVIKRAGDGSALRRTMLEANDWDLVHECAAPVLLVRDRTWASPPRFGAAVDVSAEHRQEVARAIVHTAGFLALECEAELDVLYSEPEQQDATLRMERAVRLARLVREFRVGCERIQHVSGSPEATLPALIRAKGYDCVVLGSVRSHGLQSLKEGVTSRLFDATSGDVLFVKPARRAIARHASRVGAPIPAAAT